MLGIAEALQFQDKTRTHILRNLLELELNVLLVHVVNREGGSTEEIQRVGSFHALQLCEPPELTLARYERLPVEHMLVSCFVQNKQCGSAQMQRVGKHGEQWRGLT